jgi:CDP-Glycerol:Poly(glycerophosphate) glycerophosphotransferase
MRFAALNSGPEFHALDHIAPLAAALQMPLITTEELNFELARRYYPQIEVRHMPDLESKFSHLAEEFETLFECKYWAPHLKSLFQELYGKKMRLVFCPHGQSDKGYAAPLLAPYAWQEFVLLYGDLQIQMLKELAIWPLPNFAVVGNYRLSFYQKHRPFYDALVEKEVPLNKKNRTLLYAPTWQDGEGGGSFFQVGPKILSELPADWNLIVKVHPLLEQRDPAHFYRMAAHLEKKANAILIHEFPLVYPLLAKADAYLGDSSSVGYDFLHFERPLYFLPTGRPARLHSTGRVIDPDKPIYAQLEASNLYRKEQRSLYKQAFGKPMDIETLRGRIERSLLY